MIMRPENVVVTTVASRSSACLLHSRAVGRAARRRSPVTGESTNGGIAWADIKAVVSDQKSVVS
jgi:hypothetical protein